MRLRLKYIATITYISMILLINVAFAHLPIYVVWGCGLSPMDPVAGVIYLFRDFAQRELGHYIFIAMIFGAALSFFLASPAIATASVSAFIVGELIDYGVFTWTGWPLAKRLLWSACLSAPVDSLIFLYGIHRLNTLAVIVMSVSKIIGVWLIWMGWRMRDRHSNSVIY